MLALYTQYFPESCEKNHRHFTRVGFESIATANCKGRGFESHPSNMPVIFFHRTRESTEYTVLTHIGVWVKTKINILYPRCKFNIYLKASQSSWLHKVWCHYTNHYDRKLLSFNFKFGMFFVKCLRALYQNKYKCTIIFIIVPPPFFTAEYWTSVRALGPLVDCSAVESTQLLQREKDEADTVSAMALLSVRQNAR